MNLDMRPLLALPAAEKLELIELLWDNLSESPSDTSLPEWAQREALRRRDELLADPEAGLTHVQVWRTFMSASARRDVIHLYLARLEIGYGKHICNR